MPSGSGCRGQQARGDIALNPVAFQPDAGPARDWTVLQHDQNLLAPGQTADHRISLARPFAHIDLFGGHDEQVAAGNLGFRQGGGGGGFGQRGFGFGWFRHHGDDLGRFHHRLRRDKDNLLDRVSRHLHGQGGCGLLIGHHQAVAFLTMVLTQNQQPQIQTATKKKNQTNHRTP